MAKGALVFKIFRADRSFRKALKAAVLVTLYLLLIASLIAVVGSASAWLATRSASTYLARSHWFWVVLFVTLLFFYSYFLLRRFRLIRWRLLQDLKAIPIVSP